ncbi:MAG TPA: glutathione S-transferase family protein [Polyangiaceae bacterium]|nr:glutathione S-transferase family protein [Polyangiaceae bacterium]
MSTPALPREADPSGRFVRQPSVFRERVERRPEPGRYHLYVSLACPWACRTVIVRKLKRLEPVLGMTVVDPVRDERGWRFTPEEPDPVSGFELLRDAYRATDPGYDLRVTVPVLFDAVERRVVNNESADIVRMLNAWSDEGPDLYPEPLRAEIDAVNERVYAGLNDGVYRAGFAAGQEAYDAAVEEVFATLDWLEARLEGSRFLVGGAPTEADWRLFPTLVRFDAVYVGLFKCNVRRLADYPNVSGYLRDLYQEPGIAETVDLDQIKRHYYLSQPRLNPSRIVPRGPQLDLLAPHGRASRP